MKAQELMIGDWVYGLYPNKERYEVPFRISAIDTYPSNRSPRIVTFGGYGFQEESLEPIPITPEILEKNGFYYGHTAGEEDNCVLACEYPKKGWCYGEGAGEIKIIFPNETDGGLIRIDDECFDRAIAFVFGKQVFVHELQHALRLCGIEKEIEL